MSPGPLTRLATDQSTCIEETAMRHVDLDRTRKNDDLAGGRRAARIHTQRRRRFHLQALEDRRLLTILWSPQTAETAYIAKPSPPPPSWAPWRRGCRSTRSTGVPGGRTRRMAKPSRP